MVYSQIETTTISISILDDPVEPTEVEDGISALKTNRGYIAIAPALPANWILFLVMLLNNVLTSTYSVNWTISKLIVIFKKGCELLCDNYR